MKKLPIFLMALVLLLSSLPVHATTPVGVTFDHIVVIAMENEDYASVIGSSNAHFINSLAAFGSTMSNYQSYSQSIKSSTSGCSAACYAALFGGDTLSNLCGASGSKCKSGTNGCASNAYCDGYCPNASTPCISQNTLIHDFSSNSLTWKAFCEDGCQRNADHFPFMAFSESFDSCVHSFASNCTYTTTSTGGTHIFNSASENGQACLSATVNNMDPTIYTEANSASPANLIWITPNDYHNMHNTCTNTVAAGDNFTQSLLVGTGSLASPASGSLFASNLFTSSAFSTTLYLWWDEPLTSSTSPNLEYGKMIKVNYSSSVQYNEFNSAHMIEQNRGLPYTTSTVSSDSNLDDIFVPFTLYGPGGVVSCDQCPTNVLYTLVTTNLSGAVTNSTNAPHPSFSPNGPTATTYDRFTITLTFTPTTCSTGQITTSFTINGNTQQLSTHVNCENIPH